MESKGEAGTGQAGALVVADMLFASRVRGTASAVGVAVRVVGRPDGLAGALAETGARLVLVDLEASGGRGPAAIRAVRESAGGDAVRVVAFASHTNTGAIEAGRAAGADRVLARSAFVTALPALLTEAVS